MDFGAKTLRYAGRDIPVLYRADCCVTGGGPSGTAAAILAARRGLKTVLIERGVALGGLSTLGLVAPFMPTNCAGSETPYVTEVKGRLREHDIEMSDGVTGCGWSNPEILALVYDEMGESAGVETLYHTVLVDALLEGRRIRAAIVQTIGGLRAITADIFIDGTGDAMLARLAGAPTERGSERTGRNQPMSFRFEMGGIDLDRLHAYMVKEMGDTRCRTKPPYFEFAQARHRAQRYRLEEFFWRGVASGELTEEDAEYVQAFTIPGKPGTMAMNCPELPPQFSATEPLSYSRAVSYGRAMIHRLSRYLIRHMPGFENAYISREAAMLGARESWRIRGRYYLAEADYYGEARFPDAVARTAWYIDAHGERVEAPLPEGSFYEIPYRSLVTEEVPNLIVTGRCISASFAVQASMRIQPTCMSLGEAAGVAAAWAFHHGIEVNRLAWAEIPHKARSYISAGGG